MTAIELFRRDVATSMGTGRPTSPDAFAQKLQRVFESRMRAVRIVRSAAGARRDLAFELPESFVALNVFDLVGVGGVGSEVLSSLKAFEWSGTSGDKREAQWCALLDATVENLVITNEALTDMATTVARQLVGEPGKLISGGEIAEMLGVSEEAVRQRHQAGKLIAILSAGRERGRGFPIFQAWDGIAGAPLEQIVGALGYEGPGQGKAVDAAEAFQFFTSRNELLGGFTPVEVLTGAGVPDADDMEAVEFLAKPHEERVEFVTSVARAMAEVRGE